MHLDFILTRDPPVVDVAQRRVQLGELSDGIFICPPTEFAFGGLIELSFEPDECGEFDIRAVARIGGTHEESDLFLWPLVMPDPDVDWERPRSRSFPFEMTLSASGDLDLIIALYCDDVFLGDRVVLVRHVVVPDSL